MRHLVRSLATLALVGTLLPGCGNPFADAQALDTIASYEAFLAENANSPYRIQAETRLEQLYLDKAREDKTLEVYDVYLDKFGSGALADKARAERREFLFAWADSEDTPEGWNKYLAEYGSGEGKKERKIARKRLRMAENKDAVQTAPVEMEQVNLAENPDGPLDGWGFFMDVTNAGDKAITHLYFQISYLNADGKALDADQWPVVTTVNPGGVPIEEEFKQPLQPGQSRTWVYTTGDLPADWAKTVRVVPVDIGFAGADDDN